MFYTPVIVSNHSERLTMVDRKEVTRKHTCFKERRKDVAHVAHLVLNATDSALDKAVDTVQHTSLLITHNRRVKSISIIPHMDVLKQVKHQPCATDMDTTYGCAKQIRYIF